MHFAGSRTLIDGNTWSRLKSKITIERATRTATRWLLHELSADEPDSMMLLTDS